MFDLFGRISEDCLPAPVETQRPQRVDIGIRLVVAFEQSANLPGLFGMFPLPEVP